MSWREAMDMANQWARKTGGRYRVRRERFVDPAQLVPDGWIWKVYRIL